MADELDKDAEFGGKHKDEEDPILVAQRYLNIYHQIHIFNKERQDEFDDSLLSLSSDIRILLSTLPGGSLLLDHIAELEETRGIVSLMSQLDEKTSSRKKSSKRKSQEDAPKEVEEQAPIETAEAVSSNVSNNGPNISTAILKMLKQSDEKHERDIKTLTEAFLQSQENMANILKEVLIETRNQQTPAPVPQAMSSFSPRPAFERNFSSQETPSYLQPLPEDENPVSEVSPHTAKPKLFSFTKKLFSSHKTTNSNLREEPRSLNPFVDNTPVSLDDVEAAPVDLENESLDNVRQDDLVHLQQEEPNFEKSPSEEEWDWEYVDETPSENTQESQKEEETQSTNKSDEDEWEYVEIPEEEGLKTETPQEEVTETEPNKDDSSEPTVSDTSDDANKESPQIEDLLPSEENLYQDETPSHESSEEPQAFEDSAFLYNEVPEYEAEPESFEGPVFYNQEQADEYNSDQISPEGSNEGQTSQDFVFDDGSSQWAYDEGENTDEQGYSNGFENEYADDYIADTDQPFVYDNNGETAPLDETVLSPDETASYIDMTSESASLPQEEPAETSQSSDTAELDRFLADFADAENTASDAATEDEETKTSKKSKKGKTKNKKTTGE